jgi:hypothetical protein
MAALPEEPCIDDYPYDAPDTVINFNSPVVINIHNGDGCGDGCHNGPEIVCPEGQPDGVDGVLAQIEDASCIETMEIRDNHDDT